MILGRRRTYTAQPNVSARPCRQLSEQVPRLGGDCALATAAATTTRIEGSLTCIVLGLTRCYQDTVCHNNGSMARIYRHKLGLQWRGLLTVRISTGSDEFVDAVDAGADAASRKLIDDAPHRRIRAHPPPPTPIPNHPTKRQGRYGTQRHPSNRMRVQICRPLYIYSVSGVPEITTTMRTIFASLFAATAAALGLFLQVADAQNSIDFTGCESACAIDLQHGEPDHLVSIPLRMPTSLPSDEKSIFFSSSIIVTCSTALRPVCAEGVLHRP